MQAILKFNLQIPWGMRKALLSQIKQFAWKQDIKLDIDADEGILSSLYRIEATHKEKQVLKHFHKSIHNYVTALKDA